MDKRRLKLYSEDCDLFNKAISMAETTLRDEIHKLNRSINHNPYSVELNEIEKLNIDELNRKLGILEENQRIFNIHKKMLNNPVIKILIKNLIEDEKSKNHTRL
ncbi:MAG: hypothetical protein PF448_06420 [Bacteroidales bacterium]|jgi:transcriptional regulator of heat shock response|nr:hypothetical protein [Bacteroidales bacterium]